VLVLLRASRSQLAPLGRSGPAVDALELEVGLSAVRFGLGHVPTDVLVGFIPLRPTSDSEATLQAQPQLQGIDSLLSWRLGWTPFDVPGGVTRLRRPLRSRTRLETTGSSARRLYSRSERPKPVRPADASREQLHPLRPPRRRACKAGSVVLGPRGRIAGHPPGGDVRASTSAARRRWGLIPPARQVAGAGCWSPGGTGCAAVRTP